MNDITTRARALLAAATPKPWEADAWCNYDDGGWAAIGPHHMATEDEGYDDAPESPAYDRAMADAALIAAAPELIAALCDQLDDALEECRLKRAADGDFLDDYTDGYLSEVEDQLAAAVAERNALRAEVERLKARKAERCSRRILWDDGCCPKWCTECGGSGAVFVEGGK